MTTWARAGGCAGNNYTFLTQKERDNETGLDYFLARYYSSTQGRFTSADAPFADQVESDPQSWNLYAYVRNNPLRFIDLAGDAHYEKDGNWVGDKDGEYDKDLQACWISDKSRELGGYWDFGGNHAPVLVLPPSGMFVLEGGATTLPVGPLSECKRQPRHLSILTV